MASSFVRGVTPDSVEVASLEVLTFHLLPTGGLHCTRDGEDVLPNYHQLLQATEALARRLVGDLYEGAE